MKLRRSRKVVSILVTLSFLVCMLVPMVGPASAAGTIQALSCPTVRDTDHQKLGTIKVTVPAGSIQEDDVVIFKITDGYDFGSPFSENVSDKSVANTVYVPATINAEGDANGISPGDITVKVLDPNDEVQITAKADQSLTNDFVFYIYMRDVNVEEGETDDNVVTFSGPSNTGFPTGTVTNAVVSTEGQVSLAVSGADTSNDNFDFDLRIEEDRAGSLKIDNESLKLKLPDGYEWTTAEGNYNLEALWGEDIAVTISVDDEELTIKFDGIYDEENDKYRETEDASAWDVNGIFKFTVSDESKAKAGDITVKVTGETDVEESTIVVGTYGEFGASVSAEDAPTIFAGKDEQEIGTIVIEEDLGGTLVEGRTVTLTLPSCARWQPVYEADVDEDADKPELDNFDRDESLQLDFITFTGSDDRTAKFVVNHESDDAAKIDLEDVEVAVEPGFEGDLVVEVGGSAGVSGEIVVAKVVKPVSIEVDEVPDVVIGLSGQKGADFTITETVAGAFSDEDGANQVILDLPGGVIFASTPTVKVTDGDLSIDNIKRANNDNWVTFTIKSESTEPSTISVSNVVLKLDRTVAEGDVTLKVQGTAVAETAYNYSDWDNSKTAAKAAIAKVVTPAPYETKYTTVFTIGDVSYTVNGVEKTMDVAPYIKGDRTYMPIRYAAYAAGVSDNNIIWNQAEQSVVLLKGDRVVKLVIGSNTMYINGVAFTMDVAPEIVEPGRTMLPVRWVAQALGCEVEWDATSQTVTIK